MHTHISENNVGVEVEESFIPFTGVRDQHELTARLLPILEFVRGLYTNICMQWALHLIGPVPVYVGLPACLSLHSSTVLSYECESHISAVMFRSKVRNVSFHW